MMVCLNASKREVPLRSTLESLIELLHLGKNSIVIELNRKVVERTAYASTELHENDVIEIVGFVGGG
ncbi:MAG: thiamine biosynthesis protein ThiS [Omnitrophica bacterium RIFCSPLOWO2_12_FULL_50_11]|nr:MAG: thiamine biosynthesis protein ThiS [Omnitrophica bacterium RIFCSPLOWO2_12_FULL_50_11]